MNFLIVGPGAMGCLFAARLKLAGHVVTLLDHIEQRAELINKQGIRVEGILGEYTVQVPTMIGAIPAEPDVAVICVKANETRTAAQDIRPIIGPRAYVLTLQNGLGNLEVLQEVFGSQRALGGVTAEGATLLGDGHVRHAGHGDTKFGSETPMGDALADMVAAFNDAGFKTQSAENVSGLIWGKLIVNVGINALTAITGLKNGRLPDVAGTMAVMEKAVIEAVAVSRAKGIELPYKDPLGRVVEVCRATAANIASMLQDVLKQAVTEVAFINGAIVREGKAFAIPTPVNETLTCLVQAIQETYQERVIRQA
ncbi:2-dehydropantoate 2-reductase [uncultured Desulfobacterium sp.]|uniref:2-dehydropantoate 2-reductase n=1 Tax=uncultured Desulfobacterium sp. TaxID=201089 RepID=A0A445MW05_9BACT|nr:2-dehydropantoate 2-reductase [uncultured Desulfobacterium sp.]